MNGLNYMFLIGSVLEYTIEKVGIWEIILNSIAQALVITVVSIVVSIFVTFILRWFIPVKKVKSSTNTELLNTFVSVLVIFLVATPIMSLVFFFLNFHDSYKLDEVTIDELDTQVVDYDFKTTTSYGNRDEIMFLKTDDDVGGELVIYFDKDVSSGSINKLVNEFDNRLLNNDVVNITVPSGVVIKGRIKYEDELYIDIYDVEGLEIK